MSSINSHTHCHSTKPNSKKPDATSLKAHNKYKTRDIVQCVCVCVLMLLPDDLKTNISHLSCLISKQQSATTAQKRSLSASHVKGQIEQI